MRSDVAPPTHVPGITGGLATVLLYFVLQLVLGGVLGVLFAFGHGIAMGLQGRHAPTAELLANPDVKAVLVSLTIVLAAVVMFWIVRRRWPEQWRVADPPGFGFVRARGRYYGLALAAGVLVAFSGGLLTQWFAQGHQVQQDVTVMGGRVAPGMRVLLAFLVVSVAPLVEELIFRGVLLAGLMQRMSTGWAVLASALVFGGVHLADFGFVWYPIPALAGLGVVLALLRLHLRSLWPAVVAHAANNLVAVAGWFVLVPPH